MLDFVEIPRYKGLYSINRYGKVRRIKRKSYSISKKGKEYSKILPELNMKSSINPSGYLTVKLSKDGKSKTEFIHKLVAESFLINEFERYEVNHIDHDKLNNHISNLEYVTRKENMQKAAEFYGVRRKSKNCVDCGMEILHNSTRCSTCNDLSVKNAYEIKGLTKEDLYKELSEHKNFSEVARNHSVSCNAVRKWCMKFDIPSSSKYYKELGAL